MVKAYLHEFQDKAVNELLLKGTRQVLENKTVKDTMENPIVFSSPTGSGKTIMSISFMQRFRNYLNQKSSTILNSLTSLGSSISELNTNVIDTNLKPLFIYFVPSNGDLGSQILKEVSLHGEFTFSEGEEKLNIIDSVSVLNGTAVLKENTVLVVTWDKYIKKNNIVNQITENNTTSTQLDLLVSILTKNRPVVALIDEAHSHYNDKAKSVVSKFKPDLLVKISATPKEAYTDTAEVSKDIISRMVLIPISDVRSSGLIKDKIEIISTINGSPLTFDSSLEEAVKLQKELTEILHEEVLHKGIAKGKKLTINTIENPLILIQVDNDSEFKSSKLNEVVAKLKVLGLEDKEIVTWFSNKKPTNEELSQAKVLIFKTAIALGWDYPRSHILVKLRETKSKSFDIQTIGRITRLSNGRNSLEHRYSDERLRTGYVFVENGITSTDFDKTVTGLLGNFINIDVDSYPVKEIKQGSLSKFNQIGLKNGKVTKSEFNSDELAFENIKPILNSAINQELNNQKETIFNLNKEFIVNINENYQGEVEALFKGEYNKQEKIDLVINDVSTLKEMVNSLFLTTLKNSKLKKYHLESMNTVMIGRNKKDESFISVFKSNKKIKDLIITNDFPFDSLLEKDLSIYSFLLNNKVLFMDIINKFEKDFIANYSSEVKIEGSVFSIPNSIHIENKRFKTPNEQDGWLYEVIPLDIPKTSTEENDFLQFLIENENIDFVYKNGTGGNAFNITYQEKLTHKNNNYYPDFIVVTKSGKLIIVDYKQEAVDQNIYEKFATGKHFEAGNKQLVLDTQYEDFIVTMAVNIAKQGNEPVYKYLDNNSYISINDTDYTKYWTDIELLLR